MFIYPRNYDARFGPAFGDGVSYLHYSCPKCKWTGINCNELWFADKVLVDDPRKFQCARCRYVLILTKRRDLFDTFFELVTYSPTLVSDGC